MKNLLKMMSLIAAVIFGSMVMYSCTTEDDENENSGDDGGDTPSQIQGPKWVLVDIDATIFTKEDLKKANENTVYKIDSLEIIAKKNKCYGYFSQTVDNPGDAWHGGHFLYRFEITKIPQELEGGGKIALYSKATLPEHYGAKDNHNDYAQWKYFHCQCYADCRIDGNKIRVPEEEWDKCGGYNLPVVQMNNNEPDIYESEATIIGDVPKGKKAGDKIKLIIGYNQYGANGKDLAATYTYEWRE